LYYFPLQALRRTHERPFLNTNPFNSVAWVITIRVKMHPQSFQAATIMVHTMAENIKQPEY
jgi:hypothetical protein